MQSPYVGTSFHAKHVVVREVFRKFSGFFFPRGEVTKSEAMADVGFEDILEYLFDSVFWKELADFMEEEVRN